MITAAVMLSAGAQAAAQDCFVDRAIGGSVPFLLAREAALTNARTYGAVATVERKILPELQGLEPRDWDHGGSVFFIGGDSLYNVLQIPVTFKQNCDPGTAPVDLSSYNLGFGLRAGPLTFFYTGGANSAFISESGGARGAFTLANFFVGHYYNVAAPFLGARRFRLVKDGVSSMGVDYIVGAGLDLKWLDATVGYVGSTGAYFTLDQLDLGLFGRTLLQSLGQDSLELAYLKAGKRAFDWWNKDGAQGTTTVYARKLRLPLPTVDDLQGAAYNRALEQLDLWTAHIEQRDILRYFDLTGAYTVLPSPQLYEARLSFHSPNYNQVSGVLQASRMRKKLWPVEASAYIGVVQLPRMSFYQVGGGQHLAVGADVAFIVGERGATFEHGIVRLQVWRNDPTILDIFPYAVDAWQFHLSVQYGIFDE